MKLSSLASINAMNDRREHIAYTLTQLNGGPQDPAVTRKPELVTYAGTHFNMTADLRTALSFAMMAEMADIESKMRDAGVRDIGEAGKDKPDASPEDFLSFIDRLASGAPMSLRRKRPNLSDFIAGLRDTAGNAPGADAQRDPGDETAAEGFTGIQPEDMPPALRNVLEEMAETLSKQTGGGKVEIHAIKLR